MRTLEMQISQLAVIGSYSKPDKWFVGYIVEDNLGMRKYHRYIRDYFDSREDAQAALDLLKDERMTY